VGVTLLGPEIYTVKGKHKAVEISYLIIRAADHFLVFYLGFSTITQQYFDYGKVKRSILSETK
jgi:hypothetical protein